MAVITRGLFMALVLSTSVSAIKLSQSKDAMMAGKDVPLKTHKVKGNINSALLKMGLKKPHDLELAKGTGWLDSLWLGEVDDIPIAFVNTHDERTDASIPGKSVKNLGAGKQWEGWTTKSRLMLEYTQELTKTDPDKIVILCDGGDVVFGGCSNGDLMKHYRSTVDASGGAPIVVSAEFGSCPVQATEPLAEMFAEKREKVLKAFSIADDTQTQFGNVDQGGDWGFGVCGKTSDPPKYQYLNSGFIMGPAKELVPMLEQMLTKNADQEGAADYAIAHPEKVTLDYSGSLSTSLWAMAEDRSFFEVQQDAGKHHVFNKMTGQKACFIHGNGYQGKDWAMRLGQAIDTPDEVFSMREKSESTSLRQGKAKLENPLDSLRDSLFGPSGPKIDTYVINVDSRKDRCQCMQKMLAGAKHRSAIRHSAAKDGSCVNDFHGWGEQDHINAQGGVYCSNFRIWETANQTDADYIIVLEDDAVVKDQARFWEQVHKIISCDSWNFLVVDMWNTQGAGRDDVCGEGSNLFQMQSMGGFGAHMQIIKKSFLPQMMQKAKETEATAYDWWVMNLGDVGGYRWQPDIVAQFTEGEKDMGQTGISAIRESMGCSEAVQHDSDIQGRVLMANTKKSTSSGLQC